MKKSISQKKIEVLRNFQIENTEKKRIRDIIDRELNYWRIAYPKQKELLEKFALKLRFELTNY